MKYLICIVGAVLAEIIWSLGSAWTWAYISGILNVAVFDWISDNEEQQQEE